MVYINIVPIVYNTHVWNHHHQSAQQQYLLSARGYVKHNKIL